MQHPAILLWLQLFMPLRFPGSYCRLHIGSRFVLPDLRLTEVDQRRPNQSALQRNPENSAQSVKRFTLCPIIPSPFSYDGWTAVWRTSVVIRAPKREC